MEIKKLDFGILGLKLPESIYEYYRKHFDYVYIKTESFKNIPMCKPDFKAIQTGYYFEPFPYEVYGKGFSEEYFKELKRPYVVCEDTLREVLLKEVKSISGLYGFFDPEDIEKYGDLKNHINEDMAYSWGKETAIKYKVWEKILETPQYYTNFFPFSKHQPNTIKKGIDSHKLIGELCDVKIIDSKLKQHFIDILDNKPVKADWKDTDWILYFIIESFIDNNTLTIEKEYIPDYILMHFNFPNTKTNKRTLKDNWERAKKLYKYADYTTKLKPIYDKLNASN